MTGIPDFTDIENTTVLSTVNERWGKDAVELHPADVDSQLIPNDKTQTTCPAIFWHINDCNFVIIKTAERRYRCQFFYSKELEQLGTGIMEFDNIGDCVVTLLQVQADHERERCGGPSKQSN